MKRLFALTAAAALGLSAFAGSASAQAVTGSVNVTGSVTASCYVGSVGSPTGSTFSGTIPLGELDDTTTGELKSGLSGSTSGTPAGSASFNVVCNGGNANVTLSATQLSTGSGTAPTGYSRNINYSTDLVAALTPSGSKTLTYSTVGLPAATADTLGGRLANTANDITVKVYNLAAENGASSILEAGSYSSTISVSITPTT